MVVIILNMIQMAMIYDEASEEYLFGLEVLNYIFTSIFVLEAVIKLIGLGGKNYFQDGWNRFDFFVVAASVTEIFLSNFADVGLSILRTGP